jgi:hypothetical protein
MMSFEPPDFQLLLKEIDDIDTKKAIQGNLTVGQVDRLEHIMEEVSPYILGKLPSTEEQLVDAFDAFQKASQLLGREIGKSEQDLPEPKNPQYVTSYHMGIAIDYLIENRINPFKGAEGEPWSQIKKWLEELKAKGYEGLPYCSNHDEKGWCKGHYEPPQPGEADTPRPSKVDPWETPEGQEAQKSLREEQIGESHNYVPDTSKHGLCTICNKPMANPNHVFREEGGPSAAQIPCPDCGGSGMERWGPPEKNYSRQCQKCRGTGKVPKFYYEEGGKCQECGKHAPKLHTCDCGMEIGECCEERHIDKRHKGEEEKPIKDTFGILFPQYDDDEEIKKAYKDSENVVVVIDPNDTFGDYLSEGEEIGYMYVDDKTGELHINNKYLKSADPNYIYLDLIHEFTHLRQLSEGVNIGDESIPYGDREFEKEAYLASKKVNDKLKLLNEKEFKKYLEVDWMENDEFERLWDYLQNKREENGFESYRRKVMSAPCPECEKYKRIIEGTDPASPEDVLLEKDYKDHLASVHKMYTEERDFIGWLCPYTDSCGNADYGSYSFWKDHMNDVHGWTDAQVDEFITNVADEFRRVPEIKQERERPQVPAEMPESRLPQMVPPWSDLTTEQKNDYKLWLDDPTNLIEWENDPMFHRLIEDIMRDLGYSPSLHSRDQYDDFYSDAYNQATLEVWWTQYIKREEGRSDEEQHRLEVLRNKAAAEGLSEDEEKEFVRLRNKGEEDVGYSKLIDNTPYPYLKDVKQRERPGGDLPKMPNTYIKYMPEEGVDYTKLGRGPQYPMGSTNEVPGVHAIETKRTSDTP